MNNQLNAASHRTNTTDVTIDELYEHFKKAGIIQTDEASGGARIKIYRDSAGTVKGDGLVTYLSEE